MPGWNLTSADGEFAPRAHESLVEAAERRTAIAGEKAAGVEPSAAVALFLHQNGADQRLIAVHEDMRLGEVVFIVEADRSERHGGPFDRSGGTKAALDASLI